MEKEYEKNNLDLHFVKPEQLSEALGPLKETWPGLFDPKRESKWLDLLLVQNFYEKNPSMYKGIPCGGIEGGLARYFIYALQDNGASVSTLMGKLSLENPDVVEIQAMATLPNFRREGYGGRLIRNFAKQLELHGIGEKLHINTNSDGSQVSGGWSPVHAWESYGFQVLGYEKNYGTGISTVGDGVYMWANIKELSEAYLAD